MSGHRQGGTMGFPQSESDRREGNKREPEDMPGFEGMSYNELRGLCGRRGIQSRGIKKAELVKELKLAWFEGR